MDPLSKIEQLKDKFARADAGDQATIAQWETDVRRALLTIDLESHDGIRMILRKLADDIAEMDELLRTARSDKLSDHERDRVIDRKQLYEWFRRLFHSAKAGLDATVKSIDENLSS